MEYFASRVLACNAMLTNHALAIPPHPPWKLYCSLSLCTQKTLCWYSYKRFTFQST